jgi:hypothetical protein
MQKTFFTLITVLGFSYGQADNIGYLQLLGPAGSYSLNYERGLPFTAGPLHFAASVGASIYNNTVVDLPIMAHVVLGRRHQL